MARWASGPTARRQKSSSCVRMAIACAGVFARPWECGMQRREFLTLVPGLASTGVLSSYAQAQRTPLIGFLNTASREPVEPFLAAFRKELGKAGFAEGRNVAIEYRWAEGQYGRLDALAADL